MCLVMLGSTDTRSAAARRTYVDDSSDAPLCPVDTKDSKATYRLRACEADGQLGAQGRPQLVSCCVDTAEDADCAARRGYRRAEYEEAYDDHGCVTWPKVRAKEDHELAADVERALGSADGLEASPQVGSGVRDIKEEEQCAENEGAHGYRL
ncbi:hypothetical protein MAPG_01287 [Magnaporthiopsis poae ATCC 64411]|uniref:Uncharacterized protein n=1 Tax=Magnaporthiopsis poae (strain ATCC 64411 / 73-15) TaxID=644358 RepID=A0A0C4DNA6_MAGP6|nr:hypothetical protein MAPG_01287 [Magnaporthiopsis poae ATCC 64411]